MRRMSIVVAALALAGAALAQECVGGACVARPAVRGCGAGGVRGPCACAAPGDCAAVRERPGRPGHVRAWRQGKGSEGARRAPSREARAARLRARAAELERLADEIEAGRAPARRPAEGGVPAPEAEGGGAAEPRQAASPAPGA